MHQFKVTQTYLELQDFDLIDVNKYTMIVREDLFTLNKLPVLPYEKSNNVHITIRIEVDPNL